MTMTFKLKPDPTFKTKVQIHIPGQPKPGEIEFVFKHKTRDELRAFREEAKTKADEDVILDIADGWDVKDSAFCRDSLTELFANYSTAPASIVDAYMGELHGTRRA
jgi:hypothetical protein